MLQVLTLYQDYVSDMLAFAVTHLSMHSWQHYIQQR